MAEVVLGPLLFVPDVKFLLKDKGRIVVVVDGQIRDIGGRLVEFHFFGQVPFVFIVDKEHGLVAMFRFCRFDLLKGY